MGDPTHAPTFERHSTPSALDQQIYGYLLLNSRRSVQNIAFAHQEWTMEQIQMACASLRERGYVVKHANGAYEAIFPRPCPPPIHVAVFATAERINGQYAVLLVYDAEARRYTLPTTALKTGQFISETAIRLLPAPVTTPTFERVYDVSRDFKPTHVVALLRAGLATVQVLVDTERPPKLLWEGPTGIYHGDRVLATRTDVHVLADSATLTPLTLRVLFEAGWIAAHESIGGYGAINEVSAP